MLPFYSNLRVSCYTYCYRRYHCSPTNNDNNNNKTNTKTLQINLYTNNIDTILHPHPPLNNFGQYAITTTVDLLAATYNSIPVLSTL